MILIHVWAEGSFTTQCGGPDMRPWAEHRQAEKHGCIATWMSPKSPDGGSFGEALRQLMTRDLEEDPYSQIMGMLRKRRGSPYPNAQAWQLWASVCISDFGAWFEQLTGPTEEEALAERLVRLIRPRGEVSLGTLVNLVRPIPTGEVIRALHYLEYVESIKREERANPRNKITHHIYSLV